jgi:hypothetical protein
MLDEIEQKLDNIIVNKYDIYRYIYHIIKKLNLYNNIVYIIIIWDHHTLMKMNLKIYL